jgi:general secretion pathway protein K
MRARREAGNRERGSIAILALWALTLIALLLAAIGFTTRGDLRIARNALAASQARLAAEAGTQLGLARLLRRHDAGRMYFDGTAEAWRQGSTRVAIAISDEAGKIDLNVAPVELLTGLFAAVGTGRETAELLACNILDRRGDIAPACPEPGASQIARRFAVIEELAEVPGVSEALYDRVSACVTVATGASAIDPRVAPRDVLMAIPGASDGVVDAFLKDRAVLRDLAVADAGFVPMAATAFLMATPGRDFTVVATATTESGARYRAELQIRLTGRAAQPYQVVAWRTPPAERAVEPAPRRTP